MKFFATVALASLTLGLTVEGFTPGSLSGAHAGDTKHREAKAHAHGHGKVNIAIEGRQLFVEMEVPGADIVGFEHQAKTNAEKATVAAAKKAMRSANDILELPVAAGCKLAKATVELHSEDGHGDHREFHAAYTFECASMGKLGQIGFRYFSAFKGAQELDVSMISATGAKRFEATRQQPVVKLGKLR